MLHNSQLGQHACDVLTQQAEGLNTDELGYCFELAILMGLVGNVFAYHY